MKRNASTPKPSHSQHSEEWDETDPLWNLLDQASTQKPSAFFARNVVRSVRQLESERSNTIPLGARILSLFTSRKLALSAVACTFALVSFQLWPDQQLNTPPTSTAQSAQTTQAPLANPTPSAPIATVDTATSLSELVIEESLLAAADDPSLFTRTELVAMLDL